MEIPGCCTLATTCSWLVWPHVPPCLGHPISFPCFPSKMVCMVSWVGQFQEAQAWLFPTWCLAGLVTSTEVIRESLCWNTRESIETSHERVPTGLLGCFVVSLKNPQNLRERDSLHLHSLHEELGLLLLLHRSTSAAAGSLEVLEIRS